MIHSGKFSLVEGFIATLSHNLPIYTWLGSPFGSKVKCHYIIEHHVRVIQLPLKPNFQELLSQHNTGSFRHTKAYLCTC